jgi:purine-binding chemotaxis protein CheW
VQQLETSLQQYVEVGIANEKYALKISDIYEIIKMLDITEMPHVKPYVKGVINLRGKIVPIISLRQQFGQPEEAYTKSTRIVVVNHAEEIIGIVVDQVHKVTTFPDIQPPPEHVGGVDGSYFTGIGLTNDGLVGLLKLDRVLFE